MNSKNKYSFEDLKFSLPDYINNRIEDKELKEALDKELLTNFDLQNELEEIQNTLNFLGAAEFSNPGENYFNNLSVKINEKIDITLNKESWWEKLSLAWKILIPAVPAAILIVILLSNYPGSESQKNEIAKENSSEISKPGDNSETNMEKVEKFDKTESLSENNKKNLISDDKTEFIQKLKKTTENKKIDSNYENDLRSDNVSDSDIFLKITNNLTDNTGIIQTDEKTKNFEVESSDILNNDLFAGIIDFDNEEEADEESETDSEIEDIDLLYQNDINDSKSIENEIQKLSPEEQEEILNSLKNSKL